MSLVPATPEHLHTLLARAKQEHARHEVIERLSWFADFAAHRSISRTCRTYGIARTTFYRWLKRFDPKDLSSLEDQPTQRETNIQSNAIKPEVVQALRVVTESVAAEISNPKTSLNWAAYSTVALIASVFINALLWMSLFSAPASRSIQAELLTSSSASCSSISSSLHR